jgi:4-amino-4-deoxy-L-arabinose transferase-like glycosyltransferase
MSTETEELEADETLTENVLGKAVLDDKNVKRWLELPSHWRVVIAAATFACLLFIPFLGAVGLWDPWETHYGEVAREMIARNDYVHPYWENAWFFSKPAFTMWMQAFGMQLVGANGSSMWEGPMSRFTEWGFRLPFVAFSILAVTLLALAISRVVNRRAGFATAFVLCTMPLYFLLSRQAVTDTPIVSAVICAMSCAVIAQLDTTTRFRSGWWYAFFVFQAIAVLAKGLLGLLPSVVLVIYAALTMIPWSARGIEEHLKWLTDPDVSKAVREGRRPMPALWDQMFKMKLLTGIGVFAAIALPWYIVMFAYDNVDDEGKLFWYRFLIHDHLNRLTSGVHTTTPGGSFVYFIEQGGFAIFPWVALVPGAMVVLARLRPRFKDPTDHVAILAALWLIFEFLLIGASATKFHHYVFPMLPPLAILIGLYIDRLWREGISRHALTLIVGVPLFVLVGKDLAGNPKNFTDLFVYNYDRPYPVELVQNPTGLSFIGYVLGALLLILSAWTLYRVVNWATERSTLSLVVAALMAIHGVAAIYNAWSTARVPALLAASAVVWLGVYLFIYARPQRDDRGGPFLASLAIGAVVLAFLVQGRSVWLGDLLAAPLVGAGAWLVAFHFRADEKRIFRRSLGIGLLSLGLALPALYLAYEAGQPGQESRTTAFLAAGLTGIVAIVAFVRGVRYPVGADLLLPPLIDAMSIKTVLGWGFAVGGVFAVCAAMARKRVMLFGSFGMLALSFALWFNWSHWVDLSHHWTQRDLFWRYYKLRNPGEPITSFLMNWRGETFYSKNTVKQIKDNNILGQYANQPGREWALVEHNRLGILKSAVGADKTVTLIDRDINNKFVLVTIE